MSKDDARPSPPPADLGLYAANLDDQISSVLDSHPDLCDHRREFHWLRGWLGDPYAGVWFVGENPSRGMVERQQTRFGSAATPEAQWAASRGDELLRQMLVKHGFKEGAPKGAGGWRCYLTNVVKEADYASRWREKSSALLMRAAEIWAPVLRWEFETAAPRLIVAMGKQPMAMLRYLERIGELVLPRLVGIPHYAYIGQRADGSRGPMHPERVAEYDREFAEVARMAREELTKEMTRPVQSPSSARTVTVAPVSAQDQLDRTARFHHPATRPAAGFASLLVGQRLGDRYRIDALIGRGGMGAVFRATDERLARDVALKVISIESSDPETMERVRSRFRREARAAARLHHASIVAVHDYGTEERLDLDYLVMELLKGEDLAARLARTAILPVALVASILSAASEGLAAGHRAGLVHRDIKPANLFLERAGDRDEIRVRVLDFGIAQIVEMGHDTLTHLTVFGSAPLSPAYAAPEQLRGERDLTPAADVFSLAATGFQMLTGVRPFGPAEIQQISSGEEVPVPSVRQRRLEVPEHLDRVLRRAMSLAPSKRYADAAEFRDALRMAKQDVLGDPKRPEAGTDESVAENESEPASAAPLPQALGPSQPVYPEPILPRWRRAAAAGEAGNHSRQRAVPTALELEGRVLRITPEVLREGNPRRPLTHGWLAFEIIRRQEGGRMTFEEYRQQLFNPDPEIRALAGQIPGVPDAYQDLKHIRHDIRCGRVVVE